MSTVRRAAATAAAGPSLCAGRRGGASDRGAGAAPPIKVLQSTERAAHARPLLERRDVHHAASVRRHWRLHSGAAVPLQTLSGRRVQRKTRPIRNPPAFVPCCVLHPR